ncbi:MAG: ribosome maturation factor RimP [Acidobacteria bacterium]|nr:ribosome maturation factor RimP [Acidobacteriota bacterium]
MDTTAATSRLENIRAIAERVARSRGLEVFDIQFRRETQGWVLRLFLDKPGAAVVAGRAGSALAGGVTIDDCREVSHEVGALLDVEDTIGHRYTLEVSSAGLDRPLRRADDYRRFAGCLAKMVLLEAVNGQKHLSGRLQGLEGDEVLVADVKGRVQRIPLGIIGRARLEVEF